MNGALVIGAGPAGLMAAEELARAGHAVTVAEAMPTPARKFLMAGKSGLNLTKDEAPEAFARHLIPGTPPEPGYFTAPMTPAEVMDWAQGLGIEFFTGSTGRVFPRGMKASPLLRAWLLRLQTLGVSLHSRWRWQGFDGDALIFDTPLGQRLLHPQATVLALGGASWPRLGSDAAWVPWLSAKGVGIAPFRPANMGLRVDWSPAMSRYFGQPVKGTAIHAGGISRGEWVISRHGIEGGGIYALAAAIRDGAEATLDLAPDLDLSTLTQRFARPQGKLSIGNWLRRVLNDPVKVALLLEWGRPLPDSAEGWASRTKTLPIRHLGPMGLDRAISSAGGIRLNALTGGLELRALPGIFAAGEMLDWEAPTGGYLLTHSLGTGRWAGRAAAGYLASAR